MAASTMTSKGQITIPKDVRDRLGIREGDRLAFRFDDQGRLIVTPETRDPLGNLPGLLRHLATGKPVTVEEMAGAVRRRAAKKHRGRGL